MVAVHLFGERGGWIITAAIVVLMASTLSVGIMTCGRVIAAVAWKGELPLAASSLTRRGAPTGGSASGGLWYLSAERLAELGHGGLQLSSGDTEALAIREPRAAEWLQLRFGGRLQPISLSSAWLMGEVLELPAPAPLAKLG